MDETVVFKRATSAVAVVLMIVLFFAEFEYLYLISDQAAQIPSILHTIDSSYLRSDWSVAQRRTPASPRFLYVNTFAAIGSVIGVRTTFYVVYAVTFAATAYYVVRLADELYGSLSVGVALLAAFLLPPLRRLLFEGPVKINLDKGDLFLNLLLPSGMIEPLLVGGLFYLLTRRYRTGYLLLAVASAFHASSGFWTATAATVAIFWTNVVTDDAGRLADVELVTSQIREFPFAGFGVYAVVALAGVSFPTLASLSYGRTAEIARLRAYVRHPHHHLASQYPIENVYTTILFVLAALLILLWARKTVFDDARSEVFGLASVVTISLILVGPGYVFTELLLVPPMVQLQPFYAEQVFYLFLLGGVLALGVNTLGEWIDRDPDIPLLSIVVLLLLLNVAVVGPTMSELGAVRGPDFRENPDGDKAATYRWIQAESPTDAVFLAPPDMPTFRIGTSRATVVSIKMFPFNPRGSIEWKQRMEAVCDTPIVPDESDPGLPDCRRGYEGLDASDLREISSEYDACWALFREPHPSPVLELVHSLGRYHVYRLETPACR